MESGQPIVLEANKNKFLDKRTNKQQQGTGQIKQTETSTPPDARKNLGTLLRTILTLQQSQMMFLLFWWNWDKKSVQLVIKTHRNNQDGVWTPWRVYGVPFSPWRTTTTWRRNGYWWGKTSKILVTRKINLLNINFFYFWMSKTNSVRLLAFQNNHYPKFLYKEETLYGVIPIVYFHSFAYYPICLITTHSTHILLFLLFHLFVWEKIPWMFLSKKEFPNRI